VLIGVKGGENMVQGTVVFKTPEDVTAFVNAVSKYDFDVDIIKDRLVLDAKSVEGLFTVGLSQNLTCRANTTIDNAKSMIESIQRFTVKDFKDIG
jgi:phosphotransferase system HPr-like phosphotransfer protein